MMEPNSKKLEVKQVTSHYELLSLSHLVNSFMKSSPQDYTAEDFWKMAPIMLKDGVAFYVDENGTPRAYCIIVPINLLNKPAALLFQIYSTHPHYTRMMYDHAKEFMKEKGVTTLVSLVDQDKVEYFWKNYGARIKQVLMELPLGPKKETPEEVEENGEEKEGQEGEEVLNPDEQETEV